MLSSVLNSERAVKVDIAIIMRAFVETARELGHESELAENLIEWNGASASHDDEIAAISARQSVS
jgi:hypothetical protein